MKLLLLAYISLLLHSGLGQRGRRRRRPLLCWECNNAFTNDQCLQTGSLNACTEYEAICEDQVRHYQNGNVMVIEKRCKQRHACNTNVNQNLRPAFPIQCSAGSPTSVCRCCCDTNGCNRDLLACWRLYPTPAPTPVARRCSNFPQSPANGNMQCSGNNEPGTYCTFTCHYGYYIRGERRLTCLDDGSWDHLEPTCTLKTCEPAFTELGNGTVTCSNGNFLRSRCTFSCNEEFGLVGSSTADCRDVPFNPRRGAWSARLPRCRPLVCPMQGPLAHGSFSCTRDNRVRSVCTWQCGANFEIFPPNFDTNVCLENSQWDRPWPCCTLPCLPFAVVDLMVILDSSSSVGIENWNRTTDFVAMLFDHFALQEDAAQFSAFRYNRAVDQETAIFFNDFPNNKEAFLRRFRQIPYDGSGTNTGRALIYAGGTALPRGNREEAPDIVILITDGNSQDPVSLQGLRLRSTGAEVLVVPVTPPGGTRDDINLNDMIAIAGSRENVITTALDGGFAALDEEFAVNLARNLCPPPCSNPFHDHETEPPARLRPFIPNRNFTTS